MITPEQLADPVFRLCNIYHVKHAETGKAVPFRPKPEQLTIIRAVYVLKYRKILVPKARQLGISTVIALIILDQMLFLGGRQMAIVDQTQADATKKLRGKIVYAFELLPPELKAEYEIRSNEHKFIVRVKGRPDDMPSEVQAGMNARGDTFQILHVSEWGKIAFDDPARSQEINNGALLAAKKGIVFIETTWRGGKGGDLWTITKRAMETPEDHMTTEDYRLFFFPWWGDPEYALQGDASQIPEEVVKYLDEAEHEISSLPDRDPAKPFQFTPQQRLWYYKVAWSKGLNRFEEFPSLLEECFKSPVPGAIYADCIDRLRAEGSIAPGKPDASALVHTFWDLGAPLNTVVWYMQFIGQIIRVIDVDMSTDEIPLDLTPVERAARMLSKGYNYGQHFLPHDAMQTMKTGRTYQNELTAAGIKNTRIVPRTADIWIGINQLRQLFPRFIFLLPKCEPGVNALAAYHMKIEQQGMAEKEDPVHDWSSHPSDALRTMAEAMMKGMIIGNSAVVREARREQREEERIFGIRRDGKRRPRMY